VTKTKLAVIGGIIVLCLITIYSSVFTVRAGEVAFVVQFGSIKSDAIGAPGVHWKVPFVQEVRRLDGRVRTWTGETVEIPTLGREFVLVDTTAHWRVEDPRLFLEGIDGGRDVDDRLDAILNAVVRDTIGGAKLEELIRSSDWQVAADRAAGSPAPGPSAEAKGGWGRQELERKIHEGARRLVATYGIALLDIDIKRVNYTPAVRPQVEGRMIAERQSVAERFRSEGRGRREEILGDLKKEMQTIRSEALRQGDEIRGKADAEVARIYGRAHGQEPEFYGFLKSLDAYRKAMSSNTTLMVSAESEFYQYLGSVKNRKK
jgi:membrane protease subunit HflC